MNKAEKIKLIEEEVKLELANEYFKRDVTFWFKRAKMTRKEGNVKKAVEYWKLCKSSVMDCLLTDAKYMSVFMYRMNTNISYADIRKVKKTSEKIKNAEKLYKIDDRVAPAKWGFIINIKSIMKGRLK